MTLLLSGTNGLSDVDGTAATPAIRGTDANTGIFFPAADQLAASVNGVEGLRLTSTGLGIGTSSPQSGATLTTDRAGFNQFFMRVGGTNRLSFYADTALAAIDSQNTRMAFYTNAAERMTLDTSGNLGLGVTPSAWADRAIQLPSGGFLASGSSVGTIVGNNAYWDGSAYRYGANGAANMIQFSSGSYLFRQAPSGTAGNAITFTQAMTLTADGNLFVGTTNFPSSSNKGFGVLSNGAAGKYIANAVSITSDCAHIEFSNPNGVVGSILTNGSTTSYNTSSDYRLKEAIQPMMGALAKVAALKPCTYKWKADGSDGEGFIAHELAEVVPQCVTGEKDAVDADGNPKYQGIDISFLVATLTAAIQEQQAMIAQLQADIASLKGTA